MLVSTIEAIKLDFGFNTREAKAYPFTVIMPHAVGVTIIFDLLRYCGVQHGQSKLASKRLAQTQWAVALNDAMKAEAVDKLLYPDGVQWLFSENW